MYTSKRKHGHGPNMDTCWATTLANPPPPPPQDPSLLTSGEREREDTFFPVACAKQREQFPPEKSNQRVHLEVPTGTHTRPVSQTAPYTLQNTMHNAAPALSLACSSSRGTERASTLRRALNASHGGMDMGVVF